MKLNYESRETSDSMRSAFEWILSQYSNIQTLCNAHLSDLLFILDSLWRHAIVQIFRIVIVSGVGCADKRVSAQALIVCWLVSWLFIWSPDVCMLCSIYVAKIFIQTILPERSSVNKRRRLFGWTKTQIRVYIPNCDKDFSSNETIVMGIEM